MTDPTTTEDPAAAIARLGEIETELNDGYQRVGRLMDVIEALREERRRLLQELTCTTPS